MEISYNICFCNFVYYDWTETELTELNIHANYRVLHSSGSPFGESGNQRNKDIFSMIHSDSYKDNYMLYKDITATIFGNIEMWKWAPKNNTSYNQQLVSPSFVNLFHRY